MTEPERDDETCLEEFECRGAIGAWGCAYFDNVRVRSWKNEMVIEHAFGIDPRTPA